MTPFLWYAASQLPLRPRGLRLSPHPLIVPPPLFAGLQVLELANSTAHEEAFFAIGALANCALLQQRVRGLDSPGLRCWLLFVSPCWVLPV